MIRAVQGLPRKLDTIPHGEGIMVGADHAVEDRVIPVGNYRNYAIPV